MADLTPLDEKLAEVFGLAQAAQDATSHVSGMEGADEFEERLSRMADEAAETERRTDELIDGLDGKRRPSWATGRSFARWARPSAAAQ
jgi:hypothetical protein